MERTALFIDGGYLNNVMKEFPGRTLNFEKFSNVIGEKTLFRTYYYSAMPIVYANSGIEDVERLEKAKSFYTILREIPNYEIRLGKLVREYINGHETFSQKQVDILFAIDLLSLSIMSKIRKAIIITGDSDFIPLIQKVKDEGVSVHLFHGKSYSKDLWEICDSRAIIGENIIKKSERIIKNRHLQTNSLAKTLIT